MNSKGRPTRAAFFVAGGAWCGETVAMSKVTNLNQVRKQKARAEKRAKADENAVKFGRTKAQKAVEDADAARARRELDGHRKDD